jgi:hypothetical protein
MGYFFFFLPVFFAAFFLAICITSFQGVSKRIVMCVHCQSVRKFVNEKIVCAREKFFFGARG